MYYTHMHYTHMHTHAHNDCSKNWVLILVGMKILWEEEGFHQNTKLLTYIIQLNYVSRFY